MADLSLIDEIVDEISLIREVSLPKICIKVLFLSYWMYCVNTYDVRYRNETLKWSMRLNSGCMILCEKGTGKSLALKLFKELFSNVEKERQKRYSEKKEILIGAFERSPIPNPEHKKKIEEFYTTHGRQCVGIYSNVATSKSLCHSYAQCKRYGVNNILFTVDEIGNVLEDVFSKNPSISAKEFYQSLYQLFDGFCKMGESMTSKSEDIESQTNVGANFIFVSTAEFLKDYHVQKKYETGLEAGLAKRLLYINCPPIDLWNADMNFYSYDILKFKPQIDEIIKKINRGYEISFDEILKKELSKKASEKGVIITEEYLMLFFCTALAVWTGSEKINIEHWKYMLNVLKEIKSLSRDVIKNESTNYDRVCTFIREYLEKYTSKKKIHITLVKDFCVRNRMCFDSKFKRWFDNLCTDFTAANTSKYIIERNQLYVWLSENFAYKEGG